MLNAEPPLLADGLGDLVAWVVKDGVVLGGNLINAHLVIDYTNAASFVSAGGQGEETARLIGTAFDTTRAAGSPFGRI